jgi:hypothetical protein
MAGLTKDYFERRLSVMSTERSSFVEFWKELSHWELVNKGRFLDENVNDGRRRNKHIINSKSMRALRLAVSGMFNGTMSPTRS